MYAGSQWKYTPANKDPSGVDPAQMDAISKLNDALAPTLYRTVAVQALQAHLQPALAVIQSLAESSEYWKSLADESSSLIYRMQ